MHRSGPSAGLAACAVHRPRQLRPLQDRRVRAVLQGLPGGRHRLRPGRSRPSTSRSAAVVLTPGFEAFDATRRGEFGFGFAPNVLTNVQFERLLSAAGPTGGHVLRPSDGKAPKRLAFIQCVGSRDSGCDNDYCSSVCCMAATKEAILAKEHVPGLDVTVFFLDLRAFGKDFDRYCERAQKQLGVRYVRSFISRTYEMPGTKNLRLVYAGPEMQAGRGRVRHDRAVARPRAQRIAARAGRAHGSRAEPLGLRRDQRTAAAGHLPAGRVRRRSVPGAQGHPRHGHAGQRRRRPGDGAAGAGPRNPRARRRPTRRSATSPTSRRGSACSSATAAATSPRSSTSKRWSSRPASFPNVVVAEHNVYTCADNSQDRIKEKINEHRLNRVVIASCTPRTHEPIFRDTLRDVGPEPLPVRDGQHSRPVLVGALGESRAGDGQGDRPGADGRRPCGEADAARRRKPCRSPTAPWSSAAASPA